MLYLSMIEFINAQKDIARICVPIPFPLRTVNMYALLGSEGWALIDAGIGTPDTRTAFAEALKEADLRISDLRTIVLTHHHPDHVGLSADLQEQSGATIYMHPVDEAAIQIIWNNTMERRFERVSHFFTRHGLPATELWYTKTDPAVMRGILRVPPHEAITTVEDGQVLNLVGEQYRVIHTPGHSDGHICLFRERDGVFLAADHVLPRITPNIGLYSEHDRPDPLGDYLDSLRKVADLPASIVLPGHGEPFSTLRSRTQEINEHHMERLERILQLIATQPQTAYAVTLQLFGDRLKNDEARRMAVAEILAHLEYLRYTGRAERRQEINEQIQYSARPKVL